MEGRLVPVIIENVRLQVNLRVEEKDKESFDKQLSLIQQIKEKFGPDTLLDQMAVLLPGKIENVSITSTGNRVTPAAPGAGGVITTQARFEDSNDPKFHKLESMQYRGNQIGQVDPAKLFANLDLDPETLTQKDAEMIRAYRKGGAVKPAPALIPFEDDNIPF